MQLLKNQREEKYERAVVQTVRKKSDGQELANRGKIKGTEGEKRTERGLYVQEKRLITNMVHYHLFAFRISVALHSARKQLFIWQLAGGI